MSATGRATALLTGLVMGVTCLVTGTLTDRPVTGAATAAPDAGRAWVADSLRSMTLEQKVGQLFVTFAYGDRADAAHQRNRTDFGVNTPAELIARYHLGGVIYFDWASALRSPQQVVELSNGLQRAALGSGAGLPLLICTDQENGAVVRIGSPVTLLPTAGALGAAGSADHARAAAEISGRELRAMGVNLNLAPVADVNLNPGNPVLGARTFSADPAVTATMTAAQISGYQQSVSATAKHFPGHGGTATDSHTGLAVVGHDRGAWEQLDAPPFRAAIAADVDVVMTGHIVLPVLDPSAVPATLSPVLLNGLLRQELGFDGVVMTDSLRMQGVRGAAPDARIPVLALKAGADLLLMPDNLDLAYRSVLQAVRTGELAQERIDESVARVLRLKWRRGLVQNPLVDPVQTAGVVGSQSHRALARELANRTEVAALHGTDNDGADDNGGG